MNDITPEERETAHRLMAHVMGEHLQMGREDWLAQPGSTRLQQLLAAEDYLDPCNPVGSRNPEETNQ